MPLNESNLSVAQINEAVELSLKMIKHFEGLYLKPYTCPAGKITIGFGATFYQNGRRVTLSDPPIRREYAQAMLAWAVKTVYLPAVLKLCPGIPDPHKLAAIIDWTFNLGAGRLKTSTLRKRINAGRWDLVPIEIRKWDKGGGKKLRGLTLRREAECMLI
jgi:lysozyme